MTDARLPDRWLTDRRLNRLDDSTFRSYVLALMWSVNNRTDGVIEPEDLSLIPKFAQGAVVALVEAGLWSARPRGWFITDYMITQTSRSELEVLENNRARDRRKKARQRAKADDGNTAGPDDVPGDSPGDMSRGTAQERTGKDTQGKEGPRERVGSTGTEAEQDVPRRPGCLCTGKPDPCDWCRRKAGVA